jgi:hypothetical protein
MPMAISIKPTTNHVRQSWCSFFPLGFSLCMIVVFPQSECILGHAASTAEERRQKSACLKIRGDPLGVRHVADFPVTIYPTPEGNPSCFAGSEAE